MAHIIKFGLENFRVFEKMTELEFAPITVLTGTNSSGKSSLIKALLLLKENYEDQKKIENGFFKDLSFTSGEHKLGNFLSCINKQSKNKSLVFQLPFKLEGFDENMAIEYSFTLNEENTLKNGQLSSLRVYLEKTKEKIVEIFIDHKKPQNEKLEVWIKFSFFRKNLDEIKNKKNKRDNEWEFINKRLEELHLIKELSKEEKEEQESLRAKQKEFQVEIEKWDYFYNFTSKGIFFDPGKPAKIKTEGLNEYNPNLSFIPSSLFFSSLSKDSVYNDLTKDVLDFYADLYTERTNKRISFQNKLEFITFFEEGINRLNEKIIEDLISSGYVFKNIKELKENLIKEEAGFFERNKIPGLYHSPSLFDNLDMGFWSNLEDSFEGAADFNPLNYPNNSSKRIFSTVFSKLNEISLYDQELFFFFDLFKLLFNYQFGRNSYFFFRDFPAQFLKASVSNSLNFLKSINFLEGVRSNTQRIYSYNSQGTGFNQLLLEFVSLGLTEDSEEMKFINKWLTEFEIPGDLSVKVSDEGIGAAIYFDGIPLADVGYGVTQFLPILFKIALVAKQNHDFFSHYDFNTGYGSSILFIEEPETNLHPKLQSRLADLFVDAASKFHIQFVLETHSEYLIRKLQYLTAIKEHEYKIKPSDTAIYYFTNPNHLKKGDEQVRQIKIREDGILDGSFGSGFFDEASNLIKEIFKISGAN